LFEELARDVDGDWNRALQQGDGEEWIVAKFRETFLEHGGSVDEVEAASMSYAEPNLRAELDWHGILR